MSTIKQRLMAIKRFKIDINQINKKLLLLAVILFGVFFTFYNPIKGFDHIIFSILNPNNLIMAKQTQEELPCYPELYSSDNGIYLTANTLASLNVQEDSSDNSESILIYDTNLATFQQSALLAQTSPVTTISQESRQEIITYTVQDGDTLSSVAAKFGITLNTLLWANNLKETSLIRPGDDLAILPVNGIIHRVKDGNTIGSIATYYKSNTEKIIAFNDLPADGAIQIGDKLIIPDGQMPAPTYTSSKVVTRSYTTGPGTGKSRNFPYGQCTWYVAQKRVVTWSGHAKSWLANAKALGYETGSTPKAGAIMVLTEGGWLGRRYGHVAYVEAVTGDWITISEMNYNCYACKSVRTLKVNDWRIRGYVY